MTENWKEIRNSGSWDYFMSKESTRSLSLPEELEAGKEHLSFYSGGCRGTRAVTAEGQIPDAQGWAEQDLFQSSWREGVCVCESRARCRALPCCHRLQPCPCRPCQGCCLWSCRDAPGTAASASSWSSLRSTEQPQAGTAACLALLECHGSDGDPEAAGWATAQGHLQSFLGFCFWCFKTQVKRNLSFCAPGLAICM